MIAITRQDGRIAVMQFPDGDPVDDAVNIEIAKAGIAAKSWRRIALADLPADRTYRDAWTDDGKTITVDPAKRAALDAARAVSSPVAALRAVLITKGVITAADVPPNLTLA